MKVYSYSLNILICKSKITRLIYCVLKKWSQICINYYLNQYCTPIPIPLPFNVNPSMLEELFNCVEYDTLAEILEDKSKPRPNPPENVVFLTVSVSTSPNTMPSPIPPII